VCQRLPYPRRTPHQSRPRRIARGLVLTKPQLQPAKEGPGENHSGLSPANLRLLLATASSITRSKRRLTLHQPRIRAMPTIKSKVAVTGCIGLADVRDGSKAACSHIEAPTNKQTRPGYSRIAAFCRIVRRYLRFAMMRWLPEYSNEDTACCDLREGGRESA